MLASNDIARTSLTLAYSISGVLLLALLAHSWWQARITKRALQRMDRDEA